MFRRHVVPSTVNGAAEKFVPGTNRIGCNFGGKVGSDREETEEQLR